jgi:hypothetical protein
VSLGSGSFCSFDMVFPSSLCTSSSKEPRLFISILTNHFLQYIASRKVLCRELYLRQTLGR